MTIDRKKSFDEVAIDYSLQELRKQQLNKSLLITKSLSAPLDPLTLIRKKNSILRQQNTVLKYQLAKTVAAHTQTSAFYEKACQDARDLHMQNTVHQNNLTILQEELDSSMAYVKQYQEAISILETQNKEYAKQLHDYLSTLNRP